MLRGALIGVAASFAEERLTQGRLDPYLYVLDFGPFNPFNGLYYEYLYPLVYKPVLWGVTGAMIEANSLTIGVMAGSVIEAVMPST